MEGILRAANRDKIDDILKSTSGSLSAPEDADKELNFKKGKALANRLNDGTIGVGAKLGEAIKNWETYKDVKDVGIAALVSFGVLGILVVVVGMIIFIKMHMNHPDINNVIGIFGISCGTLSLFPIIVGVLIANAYEKLSFKNATINLRSTSDDLTAHKAKEADTTQPAYNTDATQHQFDKVDDLARCNFVVAIGLGCLLLVLFFVLIFSIVLYNISESLAAPLFLFTFITSVTALTFGGIAISSAIAVFALFSTLTNNNPRNANKTLKKALASSCMLLPCFIESLFNGVIMYKCGYHIEGPIAGLLFFGFIAAIVSATTADSGIKKLFTGDDHAGHDWSPILMLAFSMGLVSSLTDKIHKYSHPFIIPSSGQSINV